MTEGQSSARTPQEPFRPILVLCLALLTLDVGMHALLFSRLPETIAVHRSVTGVVDNPGHRDLVWLGPMVHAFVIALWLVSRKHIRPHERRLAAAVIPLASLYLLSLNTLGLLSNVGNGTWQEASVDGRWMLLALTAPAVVFAAGLYVCVARQRLTPP